MRKLYYTVLILFSAFTLFAQTNTRSQKAIDYVDSVVSLMTTASTPSAVNDVLATINQSTRWEIQFR
jgi:hypothetical protein